MAPLIVITGPTASGKSSLALELAQQYGGEIICADSRTIYRGMDIGTAKLTREDQALVPHHLLDLVEPGESFSVADFQRLARAAIKDIRRRGKVPFMVGGTGLYIDSVVLNYTFAPVIDEQGSKQLRDQLSEKSIQELQSMIISQHLKMPVNLKNKRHLISTLAAGETGANARKKPDDTTHVVAITTDKDSLEQRIRDRAKVMFASGVIEEARALGDTYGWDSEAMTGNIYPILRKLINGEINKTEAIELFVISDRQLAKRQLTWLRRHDYIHWYNVQAAREYLEQVLSSHERS